VTLPVTLLAAVALLVLGLGTIAVRRSLIGKLIGVEVGTGGLALLSCALLGLSGTDPSSGQVVAAAAVAFGAAVAVVVVAVHLAASRASGKAEDLEPW